MKKRESLSTGHRQDAAAAAAAIVLELHLISAQELEAPPQKSKKMNTYIVAYIDPAEKLISRTAVGGGPNPSWNDKMIFKVNMEDLLRRPDLSIVVEIYRARRNPLTQFLGRRDERIGYVHIRLHDMIKESRGDVSSRAFLVRRTSGEPVGFLNLGLVGLDAAFHRLRLRTGSAVVSRRR